MKNLRNIRERQGLFQWQLGEIIGISQVAISAIETRESCSIETACKLADALNVSLMNCVVGSITEKILTKHTLNY